MKTLPVLVALCVVAAASVAAGPHAVANDALWQTMAAPGTVIVLRHSYAPGAFDPPTAVLEDCSTQRNLDDSGRAQARRIGEAFRAHDVAVGTVLSSPRCRCLDTARLAFGRAEAWEPLQGELRDPERRARKVAEIKQRIAAHSGPAPLVIVTHGSVVTDLTGVDVRMGGFVVLRRGADGAHTVAGQLYVE